MDQVSFFLTANASQCSVVLCCFQLLLVWHLYPGAPNKPQPHCAGLLAGTERGWNEFIPSMDLQSCPKACWWQDAQETVHFREICSFKGRCNKWMLIREIFSVAEVQAGLSRPALLCDIDKHTHVCVHRHSTINSPSWTWMFNAKQNKVLLQTFLPNRFYFRQNRHSDSHKRFTLKYRGNYNYICTGVWVDVWHFPP